MEKDKYIEDMDGLYVSETAMKYLTKSQGEYTVDDYYALPDDVWVELIDGVIYDMTAPYTDHQIITGYIYATLYNHVKKNKGACKVFTAPVDVQLNRDNRTMLQPDVFAICNKDILTKKNIFGAPDFILEVLSKSTRNKDMVIKLNKYRDADVKEYWMIDIDKQLVHTYDFTNNSYVAKTFEESHFITVFEVPCMIDFKDMYQDLLSYYE